MLIEIDHRRNFDRPTFASAGTRILRRTHLSVFSMIITLLLSACDGKPATDSRHTHDESLEADSHQADEAQDEPADPQPTPADVLPDDSQYGSGYNTNATSIPWLAACNDDSDCDGIAPCINQLCTTAELAACDRNHRSCDEELGLACDRFGVPTHIFRCDEGFVCETDPIKEACTKLFCHPGHSHCQSAQQRAACSDEGTGYSAFACPEGTRCESGQCIDQLQAAGERWCAEDGATIWTVDLAGTRASARHCSTIRNTNLDDLVVCQNDRCSVTGCAPGARRCVGDARAQVCGDDASWNESTPCDVDETCVGGQCRRTECEPQMAPHCSAGQLASCVAGEWTTTPCEFGCAADQPAQCRESQCDPGSVACIDTSSLGMCDAFGSRLTVPCPSGSKCFNAECVAQLCEPGEQRCNGSVVEYCRFDGSGYDIEVVCDLNETCVDSSCVPRELTDGPERPMRVVCRVTDTDRLRSQLPARANFPVICLAEFVPETAEVTWSAYQRTNMGELDRTDELAVERLDATTIEVTPQGAGNYRVHAEITRADGSTTHAFADLDFQPVAPLLVRLSYESQLPPAARITDDTNLNLYLRRTGGRWVAVEDSVSKLNLSAADLGGAGPVRLERFSDRPSSLEYAVFLDEDRAGEVEIGVQYWSGIFDVRPRVIVYRGQEIVSDITGPALSPDDRHPNEACVGPVWIAGTMDAATGRIQPSQRLLPTFQEDGLEQCFE